LHRWPPVALDRQAGEALVERAAAGNQAVDRGQVVEVGELAVGIVETLAGEPAVVRLRPGRLAWVDAAVAQQHLRDAVAGAAEIDAQLLARTSQIAGTLNLRRRDGDRAQRPGRQQPRQ